MTAEIRFYHLERQGVEQALPTLLQKALDGGRRVVVRAANENEVERLNEYLWVFNPDVFIPHGSKKDGNAARQPVWLTDRDENPNGADVLILCPGAETGAGADFSLRCEILDGRDEAQVADARARWTAYKESGATLTYWKQGEKGWEKKA